MRHLIINLEAPLMAFGGETIDNLGIIRRFPAASMLTGMFANALGWRRTERDMHQRLQDRLVFAARIDREPDGGLRITDFQTAVLPRYNAWTTRGNREVLGSGGDTHLRYRDFYADMRVTVALRLEPADEAPTLGDLADALDEPARPLFIGRKPCFPSARLNAGLRDADSSLAALIDTPLDEDGSTDGTVSVLWADGESPDDVRPTNTYMLTDERNWRSGLHGGGRLVHEVALPAGRFRSPDDTQEETEQ